MHKLHGEIGRVVSLSAGKEAAYQEAVAEHKSLVEVMGALRRSIALNNNLNEHQGG